MFAVLKIGGASLDIAPTVADIAELRRQGAQLVILHGCSSAADALGDRLGVPARYITSASGVRSRYTNLEALRVFILAAMEVNTTLVLALQRLGAPAVGLSGLDGSVLRGQRKAALRIVEGGRQRVIRDDFTGRIESVNTELLTRLLDGGYIPVIAPLALSAEGDALNVDGDRAAAAVAGALRAASLVILSNIPGVLENPQDEASLIRTLRQADVPAVERRATGGMRRKIMAAQEALSQGVTRVVIADGRVAQPVRAAIAGRGTVIS